MSGRIARKRRKQAVKRAAIAAGMTVATAGALAAWDWVIGPEHNFRTVYLLTASTAPAAFTYYSWEMKRYLRRPFLDIPIVAVYAGIQTANWVLLPVSDKEKTYARMRTWLKKSERVYQPHQYMIAHAEIDLHQGRFESALAKYEAALKETPEGLLGRNVFSMVAYGAAEMFSRVVTPHEKRYRQEIESAFSWYAAGHFSRALMHWKRVMEEKKDDIEVNILYAKALSAMGMDKEAQEQWADTARMVRERVDEDKFIRVEKIEGFDVYKVTPSLLLEGNFDFKISDSQDSILLEKIQTEKTNETLEDWITANSYEDRFGVMQTIGAASNGMHSLITRHEPGDTLFEYTSCSKDTGLLGDTAAYLAAMHALLTDPTLPRKDSRSHARLRVRTLEDVLPDSLYTQDIIEELEGVITVPAGKLEDDDYVFDRDAHGLNWIVTPEAKVVAIDLKTKGLVRRSYDVSKLLEIGDYFSNDPPGDGKRLRVMERYLQEAGKMGVDMPDIREFEFRKLNADLLGALSFYAATHHRREYDGIRESYVRNAEYSARRLQTDFFEFSTAEDRKGYATWAWALDGLLELCPKCVENSCSSGSAASMSLPVG